MGFDLESPTTGPCLMCGSEVEYKLNKRGKPYFTCRSATCNTTVNLNGDDALDMIEAFVTGSAELAQYTPSSEFEPDESDESDESGEDQSEQSELEGQDAKKMLKDVLNQDDE